MPNKQYVVRRVAACRDLIWRGAIEEEKENVLHCHALAMQRGHSVPRPTEFKIRTAAGWLRVAMEREGVSSIDFEETPWERCNRSLDPEECVGLWDWPKTTHKQEHWLKSIEGLLTNGESLREDVLLCDGTSFEEDVWGQVRGIPFGETRTYKEVLKSVGGGKTVTDIKKALHANRFALWIPCHRAVESSKKTGSYKWGEWRKEVLLDLESRI